MGFLAPALPWIVKGAGALIGGLWGRRQQKKAMERSPEEQQALGGAQRSAEALSTQGRTLTQAGLPAVYNATNYWQTLLGGNRAAQAQATAAPRGAITDQYRGAERNLERSNVRGATRDLAKAELARDMTGRIAALTSGVQPMAASQLGDLGTGLTAQGTSALSGVGSLYSNLLGQGFQNRVYGREEGAEAGRGVGGLIFDIISGITGKKGRSPFGGGGAGDQGPTQAML